jgi:hypothetical protein
MRPTFHPALSTRPNCCTRSRWAAIVLTIDARLAGGGRHARSQGFEIGSRDCWFKIFVFLKQDWALMDNDPVGEGCITFFSATPSGSSTDSGSRRGRKQKPRYSGTDSGAVTPTTGSMSSFSSLIRRSRSDRIRTVQLIRRVGTESRRHIASSARRRGRGCAGCAGADRGRFPGAVPLSLAAASGRDQQSADSVDLHPHSGNMATHPHREGRT